MVNMVGKIPVRNLWLLMLYASDLYRHLDPQKVKIEDAPDEIADLVAEILCTEVEKRVRKNLTSGYMDTSEVVSRVRGRIDVLTTERKRLMDKGKVACTFSDFSVNTVRNRLVKGALERISGYVTRKHLGQRSRSLAKTLDAMGVYGSMPSRVEISREYYGRNDAADLRMIAAARLACDLALPTEDSGTNHLNAPERKETWVRHLFERAVGGFYRHVLPSPAWKVLTGIPYRWPVDAMSEGMESILPGMRTDIILEHEAQRIVIDTKFTSVLTQGYHRDQSLKSGYIYQMYTYLRSQEKAGDPLTLNTVGLFIHPSAGLNVDEFFTVQGHQIRFKTIDLTATAMSIRTELLHAIPGLYEVSSGFSRVNSQVH
ncbi:5-methylcytosine-specific restriction endonuclease system specificity protein McrC [Myxococcota bacterium]|nr:5-methylcytosine-specific restriction endonuclease system specificity protein McrC [Myxococcota bacterium]MBU1382870.1 5-methylcytosine-specific restriction endonuclease system specificity protein McrC [Myxococcota bacterium]MBU1496676.1 5-methylcytosine-specific restriction endonuclease system specificity protein McrC [Myxococcota bacterium]